jgi:hypothetical protein
MNITPQTILTRTESGAALLQTSNSELSRTERLLLIMINGQVSTGDISGKLYSIPLRRITEALDCLIGRDLIEEVGSASVHHPPLMRHQIEAFLKPAELDPTTAIIADFEVEAALKGLDVQTSLVTLIQTKQ